MSVMGTGLRGISDRTSVAAIALHGGFKSIFMTSMIVGSLGSFWMVGAPIDSPPSRGVAVHHFAAARCGGVSSEAGR